MSESMAGRISLELELRTVKEELELAKKTIDRYAILGMKLYNELDTLRNGICNTCKKKFVAGAAPSFSAGLGSSSPTPSPIPFWRRVFGGRPTLAESNGRTAKTSTKQASVKSTRVSTQPKTPAAIDTVASVAKPDWSVVYNHEVKQTLNVHLAHTLKMRSSVHHVKFSRNGKYLAVGIKTGETYIYDMKRLSYKILSIVEYLPKEQPSISAIQFSPDDKFIATGGVEGHISIWNLSERCVLATFIGHTKTVSSLDFSPNGRFLLSSSWDKSVRIWCMRDGSSRKLLDPGMTSATAAVSPDGRYVAAGDFGGILRIWDFRSGRVLQRWKGGQYLLSVLFTVDGERLLSGGADKILDSCDISSLMASHQGSRREDDIATEETEHLTTGGHAATIRSVSIFPDNRWVVSASYDATSRIWNVRTGAWQCTLNGHTGTVLGTDASHDGRHLATGAADGLVRIWRYEQI